MNTNKIKEVEESFFEQKSKMKQLLFAAVGLVMSGINFMGFNPLGIAFLSAINMYKGIGFISILALALGMSGAFLPIDILKYIVILLAITVIFKVMEIGSLKLKDAPAGVICGGIALVMEVTDYIMNNLVIKEYKELIVNMVIILSVSFLTGLLFYLFRKTTKAIMEQKSFYTEAEMLGIAFIIGFTMYGMYEKAILPTQVLQLVIFFFLSYEAYKRGIGMGALMGVVCAIPLCVVNDNVDMWLSYLGITCMLGALVAVFRELGKTFTSILILVYGVLGSYILFSDLATEGLMKGIIGAAILFITLPKSVIYRIEENANNEETDEIRNICENRLMSIARTFERISKTMFSDAVDDEIEMLDDISGQAVSEKIWKNKFDESRQIMSNQFEQIAKIIEEYSKQMYDFVKISNEQEEYIRNKLKNKKVYLDKIVGIENKRQKTEYLVTARCEKGVTIGSREVAEVISEAMGKKYIPSGNCRKLISNEYTTTTYVEATNFYVMHAAAGKARGDNGISGDNYSLRELDNGQLLMGLSDGMGYGTSAALESETVIELLEQLLDSGFDADTSMKMINSVMVMNSKEDHPATLDYGVIDLHSGMCDLVKIGAAATFVKRGNWVEMIKSTSMPLGIFSDLDYDSTSKKLYHGDMIIMVSDGVIDALESENKDELLGKIISAIKSDNPKEIADRILECATEKKERLNDDMTVLVTGIWENNKKVA